MYTSIALVAAFIVSMLGAVNAISLPPSCSRSCFISAVSASNCGVDFDCLCKDTAFVQKVKTCVPTACTAEQTPAVVEFANTQCDGQTGFPIEI
ncbi:hypothetical protein BZA05DRAFT_387856 [Tricharina praecox]|uniref:uncharacterized protein n=1 Tax=Tricharina praecox TaxID=43433 RepID=UPI002220D06C|nr:uncharacterized protein BZA05DRAFT_387856 [Tricharina praecox]KAI5856241.1 hypothetical protein BZA05DRAFT_387856 [Tricharina praecox]